MYDCSKHFATYYDEHLRLGKDRRAQLASYRDTCLKRLTDGLAKLGEERRQRYGVPSRSVNQGSYPMHTLNQHPDDDFDIDVAIVFPKGELPTTAVEARKRVADALAATGGNFKDPPEARTNAVTVWYADGPHVDLAIYRESESFLAGSVLEHAGADWTKRDPEEVTNWFGKAVSDRSPFFLATVSEGQLRRIVRFVKRFTRSRDSWSLPGGMITTALVVETYQPDDSRDDVSLFNTLRRLRDRLRVSTDVANPVQTGTLLTSKPEVASQVKRFLQRLDEALPKLAILEAPKCSAAEACRAWNRVFNHPFWSAEPEESTITSDTSPSALRLEVGIANTNGGRILSTYSGPGKAVPKRKHLRFRVAAGAPAANVTFRWTVTNTGDEAHGANDITHQRFGPSPEQWEHTKYKGVHTMTCDAIVNGEVVARGERRIRIGSR